MLWCSSPSPLWIDWHTVGRNNLISYVDPLRILDSMTDSGKSPFRRGDCASNRRKRWPGKRINPQSCSCNFFAVKYFPFFPYCMDRLLPPSWIPAQSGMMIMIIGGRSQKRTRGGILSPWRWEKEREEWRECRKRWQLIVWTWSLTPPDDYCMLYSLSLSHYWQTFSYPVYSLSLPLPHSHSFRH